MRRLKLTLLLPAAIALAGASNAHAGGTVVIGPDKPSAADCEPGSKPQFEGVGLETLIVLGCASPRRSDLVVLAADESYAFACFYVSPPGATNGGPCTQVRSVGRKFGGPLTEDKRLASPVTGGSAISGLQVGVYETGTYVSGHAPAETEKVFISPGDHRADGPWFDPAALYEVPLSLGAGVGATHPFSIFVARVSPRLNTCSGIHVVAHTEDGPLSADITKSDQAYPGDKVPLPRTRGCAAGGALDIARVVTDLVKELPLMVRGA